jgi:hypothetical protein
LTECWKLLVLREWTKRWTMNKMNKNRIYPFGWCFMHWLASLFPFAVGEMEGGCRVCARECPLLSSIDNFFVRLAFLWFFWGKGAISNNKQSAFRSSNGEPSFLMHSPAAPANIDLPN